MGLLNKLFGVNKEINTPEVSAQNPVATKFYVLNSISQFDKIDETSHVKPVVLFKHSTRCSISRFALKRFDAEFNYTDDQIEWYLLDLLSYRDVSNEIAYRYNITHQSPQILVIRNGKAVFSSTHDVIAAEDLKQFV
ncbi:bacillithiol system redox-active protein YtxJ [uncultured Flavobacterium sp.]|uniref:bacillithiol system redox-active protein YtxJ n=1 Tax=uncultured Flavobacterium sp. TaxID=165435 RepID=UPI0030CA59F5